MSTPGIKRPARWLLFLLALLGKPSGKAQRGAPASNTPAQMDPSSGTRNPFSVDEGRDAHLSSPASRERMERSRQTERQHKIINETDRLLALAAELKAGVDSKGTASDQALRRAEEIEKLAHSVKERMKG